MFADTLFTEMSSYCQVMVVQRQWKHWSKALSVTHWIYTCVYLYNPPCFYACPFVYALFLSCVPICTPCVHGAKCWQSAGLATPLISSLRSPLSPEGLEICLCNHRVSVPACQLAKANTLTSRQTGPSLQTLVSGGWGVIAALSAV